MDFSSSKVMDCSFWVVAAYLLVDDGTTALAMDGAKKADAVGEIRMATTDRSSSR